MKQAALLFFLVMTSECYAMRGIFKNITSKKTTNHYLDMLLKDRKKHLEKELFWSKNNDDKKDIEKKIEEIDYSIGELPWKFGEQKIYSEKETVPFNGLRVTHEKIPSPLGREFGQIIKIYKEDKLIAQFTSTDFKEIDSISLVGRILIIKGKDFTQKPITMTFEKQEKEENGNVGIGSMIMLTVYLTGLWMLISR